MTTGAHMPQEVPAPTSLAGGKYVIQRMLGQGAMGVVYEALHPALQRRVAIKLLHASVTKRPQARERFRREALAASRIEHRNSTRVIDFGEEDGACYIVMELLDGRSLGEILAAEQTVSVDRAVWLLSQVLSALVVAHNKGIIHRDLKADNVVIVQSHNDQGQTEEQAKVCDFGLAKLQGPDSHGTLTQDGTVSGTPHYMSPEQCQGNPLDPRSDLYSCGILLYRMLTGVLPFTGDNPFVVIYAQVTATAALPSGIRPELGPKVDAFLATAMAKDPAKRFQSAREMRSQLRRLTSEADTEPGLSSVHCGATIGTAGGEAAAAAHSATAAHSVTAAPQATSGGRWRWLVVAVALVALAGGLTAWALGRGGALQAVAPAAPVAAAPVAVAPVSVAPVAVAPIAAASVAVPATLGHDDEQALPSEPPVTEHAEGASLEKTTPAAPARLAAVAVEPTGRVDDGAGTAPPVTAPVREAAVPTPRHKASGARRQPDERRRDRRKRRPLADGGARGHLPIQPLTGAELARPKVEAAVAPVQSPPETAQPEPETSPPPETPRAVLPAPEPAAPSPPPPPPPPPFNPNPKVTWQQVSIDGGMSRNVVTRALARLPQKARECWLSAAKPVSTRVRTTVKLSFVIDEDGRFRSVVGAGGPPGLASCVAAHVGRLRSRVRPDTGTVTITTKLVFEP